MLTFEASPFLGAANIVGKLQVRHDYQTNDPVKIARWDADAIL